jgi:hypothetical protein
LIEQGSVAILNSRSGRFALALSDGTYVLAEVLGADQLSLGELLAGEVRLVGPATLTRGNGGGEVDAFVLAYEVSRQAAEFEIT